MFLALHRQLAAKSHNCKRRCSQLSIALLLPASAAFVVTSAASLVFAQSNIDPETQKNDIILPILGNTVQTDRILLREIGDEYVYEGDSAQPILPTSGVIEPPVVALFESDEFKETPLSRTTWQFIQQSERLKIPDNKRIDSYRRQYDKEALWITKILNRATPFVGHIVDALDERYLPVELALLPAIESGYQPDVESGQYAAGFWQFVPSTAAEIGIKRTVWFDGRADIRESTIAAVDYLSYLNAEFHGDWLLTLAAYNAGPGRVNAAIRKNKRRNKGTDFWSLELPPETLSYVPKFLALLAMVRDDNVKELVIPEVPRGDGFEIVELGKRASIDRLAEAGVLFSSVEAADPKDIYTLPATHTVVAGDTISDIAERYGISQRRLRAMNALETSKILIGQQLAVRKNADLSDTSVEYVVSIGDTLSGIADRFKVRVRNIRNVDGEVLTTDLIHPGVKLLVNVDAAQL